MAPQASPSGVDNLVGTVIRAAAAADIIKTQHEAMLFTKWLATLWNPQVVLN